MADTERVKEVRELYAEIATSLGRAARDATCKAESLIYRNWRDVEPDQYIYQHAANSLIMAGNCLKQAAEALAMMPPEPSEADAA